MKCSICFEFETSIDTKCNHSFCKNCYDSWFMINNTCPMCRHKEYEITDILEIDDIDIEILEYVISEDSVLNKRGFDESDIQQVVNYLCSVIDYYYESQVLSLELAIKNTISAYELKYINHTLEEDIFYIKNIINEYKRSEINLY